MVIDKNMVVDERIKETDVAFYDVKRKPFALYGLYDKEEGKPFTRMDLETAKKVSEGVFRCAQWTSGARVKFKTNSPYIVVSLKYDGINGDWPQMSGLAVNGCDMYERIEGTEVFCGAFIPPLKSGGTYQQIFYFKEEGEHDLTVNMPTYARVDDMHIGIKEGSTLFDGSKYINSLPVVFYGSSITQGGCVSRPGMIYESIISRKYNLDFHNLGFAGNAKGEKEIAEYIAELPMSIFVYDYDYNAPSKEHLEATHEAMFKIIREKNPKLPIIIMSAVSGPYKEKAERRDIIKKTYENAAKSGDENVYFIDGLSIFSRYGYGWNEPTIEGCHPSDLGSTLMAKAVCEVLEENKLITNL